MNLSEGENKGNPKGLSLLGYFSDTVKRGDLGRFQLFFVSTLEAFSNMTV